jgi:oligosaccharide repeat unit polymerase
MYCFIPFLFFVIGPIQSLNEGRFKAGSPASSIFFTDKELLTAFSFVFFFYLFSFLSEKYIFRFRKKSNKELNLSPSSVDRFGHSLSLTVLASISCLAFVAYAAASGGIGNLLMPRFDRNSDQVVLGASFFLALLSIATLLLVSYMVAKKRGNKLLDYSCTLLAIFLLLVAVNPINSPRFFIVATWLPVFFVAMKGRLSAGAFYFFAMFGVMVLMPILNLTTRFGLNDLDVNAIFADADVIYVPFLDVFNTLCFAVRYVGENDFSYGQNFLAILLFFVPRFLWESKPYPGGYIIGQNIFDINESGTENLSFFVGGDFYLDFGIPGVMLAGIIFGRFVTIAKMSADKAINGQNLLEYIVIASLPILMRGPFASVLLLFSFQLLALIGLRKLVQK